MTTVEGRLLPYHDRVTAACWPFTCTHTFSIAAAAQVFLANKAAQARAMREAMEDLAGMLADDDDDDEDEQEEEDKDMAAFLAAEEDEEESEVRASPGSSI